MPSPTQQRAITGLVCVVVSLLCVVPAYCQLVANFSTLTPGDSCRSRSVQFNASSSTGSITSYGWSFVNKVTNENIGTGSGVTILKNFLSPGIYTVTLVVTASNGATATRSKDIQVYRVPDVNFSTNVREGCPPLDVTFQDLSSPGDGTIVRWEWNYNDGSQDVYTTVQSPTHRYAASNHYSPTLIVTNSNGCTASATKTDHIQVYNRVRPTFLVRDNYSCTAPHTATMENTSPLNGPFIYTWDFGDGITEVNNDPFVSHTYTSPGVYVVRLTATNATGTCSDFTLSNGAQNIYIGRPTADFNLPANICVGGGLTLSALPDATGLANNGRWLFEDTNTAANGFSNFHRFNTPGTWEVRYASFNSFSGCRSDTVLRTIDVLPSPVANFVVDRNTGCRVPHAVTLTNTSTDATRYEWNFGDGSPVLSTTDAAPLVKEFSTFGQFNVRLTAYNDAGCSNTRSLIIRTQQPTIDFDYTPNEGCTPLTVRIRARSQSNDPIATYTYSFSDGTIDVTTSPEHQHTFTVAGLQTISVQLTTQQGCTAISPVKEVSVSDVCDSDGSGGAGGNGGGGGPIQVQRAGGCNDKYTFTFHDTTSNVTILSWDFEGTLVTTSQNPITHTFPDNTGSKRFLVTVRLQEDPPSNALVEHRIGVRIVDEKANYLLDRSDICRGLDIGFETIGIDSSNIRTYTWDFGDETPRRVINNEAHFNQYLTYLNGDIRYTYLDTGRFETKLIIVDKFGCEDSISYAAPVTVKGPVAILEVDRDTICSSSFTIQLADQSAPNGTVPIVNRVWNFGDGSPDFAIDKDTTLQHVYSHTSHYRDYTASLTITDDLGCTDRAEQHVRSFAPKARFFTYDTLRCGKFDILFYNQSSAIISDNRRFTWSYGDGLTSHGYTGSHTYLDTGYYSIQLKVIDDAGCMDSVSKSGYVKLVRPIADFDIGADTSKCVGTFSLPFVSRSTYGNRYAWDYGDGSSSETSNIEVSHFYERAGFYDVTLFVTGLDGCTDEITKQVKIKGPWGDLEIDEHYLCVGSTFSAKVDGQNIKDFYWDFDDLSPTSDFIKADSVGHIYQQPGKYIPNVILLSPENCQITLEASDTVYVDQLNAGMPANIECGDTHTSIHGTAALNLPDHYYWEGPAGVSYIPDHTSLLTSVDIPGFYVLKTTKGICSHPDTVLVTTSGIVPTADAGLDKRIDCISENTQLNGSTLTADTRFEWTGPADATFLPASTDPNPVVTLPGEYVLTVVQKECTMKDTVMVSPCSLNATDTSFEVCANEPGTSGLPFRYAGYDLTQLNNTVIGGVPSQVSWFRDQNFTLPVSTPLQATVANGDEYYAKIVSLDGLETDRAHIRTTVHSYVNATIQFNNDTICESNGPILISSRRWTGNDLVFEWLYNGNQLVNPHHDPQAIRLTLPQESGVYVLRVSNPHCPADHDTLNVKIYESPKLTFTSPFVNALHSTDNTVVIPLEIQHSNQEEITSIRWSPDYFLMSAYGNPSEFYPLHPDSLVHQPHFITQTEEQSLTYTVSVTAGTGMGSCTSTASIVVNNYIPIKIPNAFTPNDDGLNDNWVIRGLAKYPKTSIKVLNQWGQLLFEDNRGYKDPWNGFYKNERVPFGTYYYIIDFLGSNDGSDHNQKGWLVVME